jgi:hypothetical protein
VIRVPRATAPVAPVFPHPDRHFHQLKLEQVPEIDAK